MKRRIGSATSAGLKGFLSDSPKSSAERNTNTMTKSDQCHQARLTKAACVPSRGVTNHQQITSVRTLGQKPSGLGWLESPVMAAVRCCPTNGREGLEAVIRRFHSGSYVDLSAQRSAQRTKPPFALRPSTELRPLAAVHSTQTPCRVASHSRHSCMTRDFQH